MKEVEMLKGFLKSGARRDSRETLKSSLHVDQIQQTKMSSVGQSILLLEFMAIGIHVLHVIAFFMSPITDGVSSFRKKKF